MSSVLLAVRTMARRALRSATAPDFLQLTALVKYVERFPEAIHQLNEEKLLFRTLEDRQPALARTVARFRRDHAAMKGYGIRYSASHRLALLAARRPQSGSVGGECCQRLRSLLPTTCACRTAGFAIRRAPDILA